MNKVAFLAILALGIALSGWTIVAVSQRVAVKRAETPASVTEQWMTLIHRRITLDPGQDQRIRDIIQRARQNQNELEREELRGMNEYYAVLGLPSEAEGRRRTEPIQKILGERMRVKLDMETQIADVLRGNQKDRFRALLRRRTTARLERLDRSMEP